MKVPVRHSVRAVVMLTGRCRSLFLPALPKRSKMSGVACDESTGRMQACKSLASRRLSHWSRTDPQPRTITLPQLRGTELVVAHGPCANRMLSVRGHDIRPGTSAARVHAAAASTRHTRRRQAHTLRRKVRARGLYVILHTPFCLSRSPSLSALRQ